MLRRVRILLAGCCCLVASGTPPLAGVACAAPAPAAPAQSWLGTYFNNTTLSAPAAFVRNDGATLAFTWPASPGAGISADYFSARWTSTSDFSAGTYEFTFTHDDGGRLLVDGAVVLEQWYMQIPTTYTVDLDLAPGPHTITVEYYTTWGTAVAQLGIAQLSSGPLPPTPTPTPTAEDGSAAPTPTPVALPTSTPTPVVVNTPTATATATPLPPTATSSPTPTAPAPTATPPVAGALQVSALVGDYFNNVSLSPPDVLKRDDGLTLDVRWTSAPAPGVNADDFSVRWGQLIVSGGGAYQLVLTHDDGARLSIDGSLLIDDWQMQVPVTRTANVTLSPGEHLLKLEYYHTWGGAVVSLAVRLGDGTPAPIVGLGSPTPTVTPSATSVPPAAPSPTPTATIGAATATASPTALPVVPAPTATPTVTATATTQPAPPTATSITTATPTATPLPGSRDKTRWPFASSSIWNMPIGASASYVPAAIRPRTWMTVDDEYSFLSNPTDPLVPFYTNGIWGSGRCATSVFRYMVNIPAAFVLPDGRVGWMPNAVAAILAPDGRTLHQMSPLSRCAAGGPLTAGWVSQDQDIYGDGIRGGHGGSGLSSFGGSVRLGELTGAAPIRHALKVNLWASQALSPSDGGFRWPAVRADSYYNSPGNPSAYNGAVPQLRMGALLAIPAGVDLTALGLQTPAAKKLAWTLQNYGAYVVDDTAWDADALAVQAGVREEFRAAYGMGIEGTNGPWRDDMMKLFAALNVVDNNSPTSIGGGGSPLQPLAPPIGN